MRPKGAPADAVEELLRHYGVTQRAPQTGDQGAPSRPAPSLLRRATDLLDRLPAPTPGTYAPTPATPSRPAEEPITESLNPIELTGPGFLAKGAARLVGPQAGRVLRTLSTGAALEAGYKLNQATGMTPGDGTDLGWPEVINFGVPALGQTLSALKGVSVTHFSRAGRALRKADQATALEQDAYTAQGRAFVRNQAQHGAHDAAMARAAAAGDRRELTRLQATAPPLLDTPGPRPLPVEPTVQGPSGGRTLGEMMGGTLSGTVSGVLTGQPLRGALLGAGSGMAVGLGDRATARISQWLLASPGRVAWLRGHMASQGLSPAALSVLSAVGRGALPEAPEAPSPP